MAHVEHRNRGMCGLIAVALPMAMLAALASSCASDPKSAHAALPAFEQRWLGACRADATVGQLEPGMQHGFDSAGAESLIISADQSTLEGSLPKARIAQVIRGHLDEVRACYSDVLELAPDLQGELWVRFAIDPGGHVAIARAHRSSLDNAALECCVTSSLKDWSFDPTEDGSFVVVTYGFLLQQVGIRMQ